MPPALHPLHTLPTLAEQAERLIELGAHRIGGLSAAQLREEVARARAGRGLLVMHPDRAPASELASLAEHRFTGCCISPGCWSGTTAS